MADVRVTSTLYIAGQEIARGVHMYRSRSVAISLETACDHAICAEFAFPLYKQLSSGAYDRCSVLELGPVSEWLETHRTARKRAARAARRGYQFKLIERHERADEIYAINVSAPERQGRPMSGGYQERPSESPLPVYPCERHGVHTYGVEDADGTLVAYTWIYRAGQLALVSQILGHAEHLANEIMYLLVAGMLRHECVEPGFVVYNRHDSGGPGLVWFKERLGFTEQAVEWRS